mmetsp:Transcript_21418/g.45026  ORF Transcript_21418/g.45026 Transcript_21418/m.45026 type:complete len:81 (-) Transcript_21418:19-261(-)
MGTRRSAVDKTNEPTVELQNKYSGPKKLFGKRNQLKIFKTRRPSSRRNSTVCYVWIDNIEVNKKGAPAQVEQVWREVDTI